MCFFNDKRFSSTHDPSYLPLVQFCILFLLLAFISIGISFSSFADGIVGSVQFSVTGTLSRSPEIEVYMESNGKFYDDITLDPSSYNMKRTMPEGVYTFYSRVRFDKDGEYILTPTEQTVKVQSGTIASVDYRIRYEQKDFSDDSKSEVVPLPEESSVSDSESATTNETLSDEEIHALAASINEDIEKEQTDDDYELENNFMALHGFSDPSLDARLDYGAKSSTNSGTVTSRFNGLTGTGYTGEAIKITVYNGNTAYDLLLSSSNNYTASITVPAGEYVFGKAETLSHSTRFNLDKTTFTVKNEETTEISLTEYTAPDSIWVKNPFEIIKNTGNTKIIILFSVIILVCGVFLIHHLYKLTHKGPDEFM